MKLATENGSSWEYFNAQLIIIISDRCRINFTYVSLISFIVSKQLLTIDYTEQIDLHSMKYGSIEDRETENLKKNTHFVSQWFGSIVFAYMQNNFS